jgi:hypothetical protein
MRTFAFIWQFNPLPNHKFDTHSLLLICYIVQWKNDVPINLRLIVLVCLGSALSHYDEESNNKTGANRHLSCVVCAFRENIIFESPRLNCKKWNELHAGKHYIVRYSLYTSIVFANNGNSLLILAVTWIRLIPFKKELL